MCVLRVVSCEMAVGCLCLCLFLLVSVPCVCVSACVRRLVSVPSEVSFCCFESSFYCLGVSFLDVGLDGDRLLMGDDGETTT